MCISTNWEAQENGVALVALRIHTRIMLHLVHLQELGGQRKGTQFLTSFMQVVMEDNVPTDMQRITRLEFNVPTNMHRVTHLEDSVSTDMQRVIRLG